MRKQGEPQNPMGDIKRKQGGMMNRDLKERDASK